MPTPAYLLVEGERQGFISSGAFTEDSVGNIYQVSGHQEHYYTIKLIDAVIVNITTSMPHAQNPGTAHLTHMESVSFSYRGIEWNHEVCGTSGGDDWRKPMQV